MDAGGSVDPVVTFRKWQRGIQRAGCAADRKNVVNSRSLRARQHHASIGIEFRHVHVRMRIDELELRVRSGAVFHGLAGLSWLDKRAGPRDSASPRAIAT